MRRFFIFLGTCGVISLGVIFFALVSGVSPRSETVIKPIKVKL